jgi:hypothetical protein
MPSRGSEVNSMIKRRWFLWCGLGVGAVAVALLAPGSLVRAKALLSTVRCPELRDADRDRLSRYVQKQYKQFATASYSFSH